MPGLALELMALLAEDVSLVVVAQRRRTELRVSDSIADASSPIGSAPTANTQDVRERSAASLLA